ncbi:MAG: hypothetical protein KY394_00585 [Actinobacteria bacterium]|nr:hypothetical protein [Actinomycetota bacterium]
MIEVWALAGALAAGVDWRRLAVLGGAVLAPLPATLLVGYAIWKGRRATVNRAALFCEAASAELRAGASLRSALETSARSVGCASGSELARTGAPLGVVARAVGAAMPEIRAELELTIVSAQRSGSRVADLFDEVGSLAIARAEVAGEVQMSTSPVRATVLVFAAAPLAYLATRGALPLGDSPGQAVASMAGAGLFLVGLGAVAWMIWRAT